jgi:hypothetical protein
MLYDLIGVSKNDFDDFIGNINSVITKEGTHWKHVNPSPHDSVSIKFDKYFEDQFKNVISESSPKQGAFCGKSILQLLEPHSSKKYVLTLDIKNFFESINFHKVEECTRNHSSLQLYSDIIHDFYFGGDDQLRRGLKGSAAIAEVVGLKIDHLIQKTIHSNKDLVYSRYYDDIIISGDSYDDLKSVVSALDESINQEIGLSLNPKKTKLRTLHGSKILGLRFHGGGVTVPQSLKRKLRVIIYEYTKANYDESDYESVRDAKRHVGKIIGTLRYIINFTSANASWYDDCLANFYGELDRLEEIRKELAQYDDERLSI